MLGRWTSLCCALLALCANVGASAQTLSTYGAPGLVDMPTAARLPDGYLALSRSQFGNTARNTLTFQVLPSLYGSFRYSIIDEYSAGGPQGGTLFDRSFDLHLALTDETETWPALGIGLRDFGGTGVYASEYLVATKSVGTRVKLTGGLGWGRLADIRIAEGFGARETGRTLGNTQGGELNVGAWFSGDIGGFAGLEVQASDRVSLQLEYSSDQYTRESVNQSINIATPFNAGLTYDFQNGSSLRGFIVGGTDVGLQYSYRFDPAKRRAPGGLEPSARPLNAAAPLVAVDNSDADIRTKIAAEMTAQMADEGIVLRAVTYSRGHVTVRVQNNRWDVEAQALGRALRVMANVLPAGIERFTVTFEVGGVAQSSVTMSRADLVASAASYDGAWQSLVRAEINDGTVAQPGGTLPQVYPQFEYGLGPYTAFSLFDPDRPVRYDVGAELTFGFRPTAGLSFSGILRQPVTGTIDKATRMSTSVLPRVRSDVVRYAKESDLEINQLTAEYMFRPGPNLFGRVTVGYLENMFGGLSAEVLWYPLNSRLALGAEVNYAQQRDFDMGLGFQDYSVVTGHASAYYDLGNGFTTQLDVGRYLASDWGATFSLDRVFNNGFRVGGYFTLTEVPFEVFGEGSFDKGLRIFIPLSWLTGRPSRDVVTQVIQPILRDGGARLEVANRLYGVTRDYRAQSLRDGWGRFYR